MKKLLSLFLVLLFLTTMTYPAFGADHRETALAYLVEKYDVPREKIELYEGGITKFEYTGESFWMSSYMIITGEKPQSDALKGEEPRTLPAPEIMPLPAEDAAPDRSIAVAPAMPGKAVGGDYIYGGIYIRIKTGEILEEDKMRDFYAAEDKLIQQEWERLRKEAGKLDVSLYKRLKELSAGEKVTVSIQPVPVGTDDIRAQFDALKKKYPKQTNSMDISIILQNGMGYDLPAIQGGGASSSDGSVGYAVPANDAAVSYPAPASEIEPAAPVDKPDVMILPADRDEKSMQEYNAMWQELEQIRLQSVAPSIENIKKTLEGMNISYKDKGAFIEAEMTASQINDIAKLPDVSTVYEEVMFLAEDAMVRGSAPVPAPNVMMAAATGAEKDASVSSNSYVLIAAAALFGAVTTFIIYRRRMAAGSKK